MQDMDKMPLLFAKSFHWRHSLSCTEAVRKDNMVYPFSGLNFPNAFSTIEEVSDEPEPESLKNIEYSMECRDAVTMSEKDGFDGSSQEDDLTTKHQFRLHLSPREQETAHNSIFYSWMKPEAAYSRQILNTYLNVLKRRVPSSTYLMDMNDFKFLCSHEELSSELISDYFHESLTEKRLLIVPCESEKRTIKNRRFNAGAKKPCFSYNYQHRRKKLLI